MYLLSRANQNPSMRLDKWRERAWYRKPLIWDFRACLWKKSRRPKIKANGRQRPLGDGERGWGRGKEKACAWSRCAWCPIFGMPACIPGAHSFSPVEALVICFAAICHQGALNNKRKKLLKNRKRVCHQVTCTNRERKVLLLGFPSRLVEAPPSVAHVFTEH